MMYPLSTTFKLTVGVVVLLYNSLCNLLVFPVKFSTASTRLSEGKPFVQGILKRISSPRKSLFPLCYYCTYLVYLGFMPTHQS